MSAPAGIPLEDTVWRLTAYRADYGQLVSARQGCFGAATAVFSRVALQGAEMEVDEEVLMGIPLDRRRIPDRAYLIIVVAAGGVPHPPQPTRLKALKIYDGCNWISAGYEVTSSALVVTLGMGTLRGCGQDVSEQANAYRAGLVGAGEFTIDGRKLRLPSAEGEPLLTFTVVEP